MWSDTERWGSHSFTHYANEPTLRQAVRTGRATDTITHYVEMDEGQTEASRALSASVRLGTLSRHHVPESLLPFLQITLAVAHACAPSAVSGQMYGHGFPELHVLSH